MPNAPHKLGNARRASNSFWCLLKPLWLLSARSCALQVSKGLLDTAMKAPQRPQRPTISSPAVSGPEEIAGLLTFREQMLTAEIGLAMTRASKGAGSGQSWL